MRCPGTLCKSCDLEESLTLRAINPVTHSFELKSLDVVFILPPVNDYPFTNDIPKVVQFIQTIRNSPLFAALPAKSHLPLLILETYFPVKSPIFKSMIGSSNTGWVIDG